MTPQEKIEILNKLSFNYKDVMALVGCKKSKAHQIMNYCRQSFNGIAGIYSNNIKPQALFTYMGTTLEEEIKKTRMLLGDK